MCIMAITACRKFMNTPNLNCLSSRFVGKLDSLGREVAEEPGGGLSSDPERVEFNVPAR
jgi:hypothetical protein